MSAETVTDAPALAPVRARRSAQAMRAVAGVLADGTVFFIPAGEIVADGDRVACHLCGRLFRSVSAHLRSHGWTKEQYCMAFGLECGQSLEGQPTRKLRSAAFSARLTFEPAVREGSAKGRQRARSGELTNQAAEPQARLRRHAEPGALKPRPPRHGANVPAARKRRGRAPRAGPCPVISSRLPSLSSR